MSSEAVVIALILYCTLYIPILQKVEGASHVASYVTMASNYTVEL